MMGLHRDKFNEDDLVKVDTSKMVVLGSGGPLLTVETVEGDNVICSWEDWSDGDVKIERAMFHKATLCILIVPPCDFWKHWEQ